MEGCCGLAGLYERYEGKVRAYIGGKGISGADADDLCQAVFEKVCANIDGFDIKKAGVGTWIYAITRNCVIDYFRKSKPVGGLPDGIADGVSLEDAAVLNDVAELLACCLNKLSQRERDIIVLYYYRGWPMGDIARALGLSDSNARMIKSRSLRKLKKMMEEA